MDASVTLPQATVTYRDEGQGHPIVFAHGLLVDGTLWRKVTPLLASRYRCIVPDLPLGAHTYPLEAGADRSPRGVAHLLADFIAALGLESVTVVGNDTGGAIAQLLVTERPERIGSLVLTNCDCLENFLPPIFRPLRWAAYVPGSYWLVAQMLRSRAIRRSPAGFGLLTHRPVPAEVSGAWSAPLRNGRVRRDLIATLKAIDRRDTVRAGEHLREFVGPTLLAWAPEDRVFPLHFAETLQSKIPGAELELIGDSRAFVPEDNPELLAEVIAEYLARHDRSEASGD
jgi:pimeloyl-ACP methyl ester carboxylesterase